MLPIELQLIHHQTKSGLVYQHFHIQFNTPNGLIKPQDLKTLQLPEGLDWSQGVVLEGKATNWLYGHLVGVCHQAIWVGCFDTRFGEPTPLSGGAVVVTTRTPAISVGQVLLLDLPDEVFRKSQTTSQQSASKKTAIAPTLQQQVQLQVTELRTPAGNCQTLAIELFGEQISPEVLATLALPELDWNRGVILFGQIPIWLYGYLVWRCQEAPWIACFAARQKEAVVVQSQVLEKAVGDALPVLFNRTPCPAIAIGGPPDSGKSVLSNALRLSLMRQRPTQRVFLHRANWDGEGNWAYESPNRELVTRLTLENEFRLHEHPSKAELLQEYFVYHSKAVANLRDVVDLVLVDVGGMVQSEKIPLVEKCTHYIVVSKDPQVIQQWHDLFGPTAEILAVIHSTWPERLKVLQTQPFLEIEAEPWREGVFEVPEVLLQEVLRHWV